MVPELVMASFPRTRRDHQGTQRMHIVRRRLRYKSASGKRKQGHFHRGKPGKSADSRRHLRPWGFRPAVSLRSLPYCTAHEADEKPWRHVWTFSRSHGMTRWPSWGKSWASCGLRANRMRSHASLPIDLAAWMICGFSFSRHMVLPICSGCRRRPMVSDWPLS